MGKIKLRKWDSAEHLNSDEDIALARETGLGRESLYKALSGEGNPSFATILKVIHALGVKLHAETAHA